MKTDPTAVHIVQKIQIGRPLLQCAYHPQDPVIFVSGQDSRVWRVTLDKTPPTELNGHESWVFALAVHPEGHLLYSGGGDGQLLCWLTTGRDSRPRRSVAAHQGWIRDVAISADGTLLATCGNDKLVKIWNADDGKLRFELRGHASHVDRLLFHPSGNTLVSGDLHARLVVWDVRTGQKLREMEAAALYRYDKNSELSVGGIRGIAFSADGQTLAVSGIREAPNSIGGTVYPGVVLLDFPKGEPLGMWKSREELSEVPWEVAFHPTGFFMAATARHGGGHLLFWRKDNQNEFHSFKLPEGARDMSLHPDQIHVATAHGDGHLCVSAMTASSPLKKDAEAKPPDRKESA